VVRIELAYTFARRSSTSQSPCIGCMVDDGR
jgi:hypothetical protein